MDVPSAQVLAIFEEALALGRALLAPRVVYRAVPVTGGAADRLDAGGERLHIPQIARLWGSIEAVGAGICTVGTPSRRASASSSTRASSRWR